MKRKLTLLGSVCVLMIGISNPVFAGGGGPPKPSQCAKLQNVQSGVYANYVFVSNRCPYGVTLNYYDSLDRRWKSKGVIHPNSHGRPFSFYAGSFISKYNFEKAN